jgi:hypothetical protein
MSLRTQPARRRFFVGGLLGAALLLSVAGPIAAAQDAVQESEQPVAQPQGYEFPIQINSVEVQTRGSDPTYASIIVDGVVGNGCTRLERIEHGRDGNRVSVSILGFNSGDPVCTMVALTFQDNIGLEGTFGPGDYVVDVNGVTRNFHVD